LSVLCEGFVINLIAVPQRRRGHRAAGFFFFSTQFFLFPPAVSPEWPEDALLMKSASSLVSSSFFVKSFPKRLTYSESLLFRCPLRRLLLFVPLFFFVFITSLLPRIFFLVLSHNVQSASTVSFVVWPSFSLVVGIPSKLQTGLVPSNVPLACIIVGLSVFLGLL